MEEILSKIKQTILDKGFNQKLDENMLDSGVIELIYSDGGEKHIYCRVYPEGYEWGPAIKETTITEAMLQENYPAFAWTTNGESNYYIDMNEEKSISHIPDVSEVETTRRKYSPKERISKKIYHNLQEEFNNIHKKIYSAKDHVNNTNDAIDEVCKLIFLEVFRLNHPTYELTTGKNISQVVQYTNIVKRPEVAVEEIREAFKEVKNHQDYKAEGKYDIFDKDQYIKLENPQLYKYVFNLLQNLDELIDKDNLDAEEKIWLKNNELNLTTVASDVLGRVFDVMLRGKFENKGGLGIYLTARQVTEIMAEFVFHDLKNSGKIIEKDSEGKPVLRICDPACGTGGFLIEALKQVDKYMTELGGWSSKEKEEHLNKMKEYSFIGADNAPGMVLKARINMALHGSPKARIIKVSNSLTTDQLKPESFDVILTNPPFGKEGGYSKKDKEEKKVLEYFSTDITNKVCQMQGDKLALGSKKYSNGWKLNTSVNPEVLFIDRCMQLLKPGGLLCIVLPDSVLSNSGEQYVREYLMGTKNEKTGDFEGGKAIIKAVVSLPTETFKLSGTSTKTSFLYLKKKEHPGEKQGKIFMAVADEVGFEVKNKVEKDLGDDHNDLLDIVEAYKKGE